MKDNLSGLLGGKNNEISTESFTIRDNFLKVSDLTIQLSNISYFSAGVKKFRLPGFLIAVILISLLLLSIARTVPVILLILSAAYIWYLYEEHQKNKLFLSFDLNSGKIYRISFPDMEFLKVARDAVEKSMDSRNANVEINIKEQRVYNGDDHSMHSEHMNINSHNNNDSSINVGDIKNNTMSGVAFGNENTMHVNSDKDMHEWHEIKSSLESVVSAIKIESPVKDASLEALQAAKKEDKQHFEVVVKKNKAAFVSDLFQNTASQFLAQYVSKILGV